MTYKIQLSLRAKGARIGLGRKEIPINASKSQRYPVGSNPVFRVGIATAIGLAMTGLIPSFSHAR